ncbi:MAG: zinc-ribbon domain-containing protein [Candidatus Helarchaeota archaeon]|nr:zinc-ribbon domain-containing protein [Candidatus Helarchaeota archaeon]
MLKFFIKCPKCEKPIPNDAKFCIYCGINLNKL